MDLEEYFHLDKIAPDLRYEYDAGTLRLMSGGTKAHDDIAFNIRVALKQHFQSGPCSVQGSDMRVQVTEDCYYYPDVTVTCDIADRRRDAILIRSPRIVVEVLSPSTEKSDRIDKLRMYQRCPTIQEIVLVNQYAPHVEVYRREEEKSLHWQHLVYEPEEALILESVDIQIPMEEVYQGIDFDQPLVS